MVLTQEDKEWIQNAFKTSVGDLESKMSTAISTLGKRVVRVEQAYGMVTRAARTVAVDQARKNHARLLQEMFDSSEILAVPTLVDGEGGKRTRGAIKCDLEKVQAFIAEHDDDYDVELAPKLGFRLVHNSRSAQKRRKAGALVFKNVKKKAEEELGLHLQYDKPVELRGLQASAQKFMAALKRAGGSLVESSQVRGGYLLVNGIRLAPEYLVPQKFRWDRLMSCALDKIRNWGPSTSVSPEQGFMYDIFCSEFTADLGIVELDDLLVDDEPMPVARPSGAC
jgi:hypothetical protein